MSARCRRALPGAALALLFLGPIATTEEVADRTPACRLGSGSTAPDKILGVGGRELRMRWGEPENAFVVGAASEERLVYCCDDSRIVVVLRAESVEAVHVQRRTRNASGYRRAEAALVARLGPPSERRACRARWSLPGLDVEVAGSGGEYDVTAARR